MLAAIPHRADGMNYVPRRQPVAAGDFGVAGAACRRNGTQRQLRPGGAVNRAIDATAGNDICGGRSSARSTISARWLQVFRAGTVKMALGKPVLDRSKRSTPQNGSPSITM